MKGKGHTVTIEATGCLHCDIVQLAQSYMDRGMSVNEVAFKEVEALATLIAGVGNAEARRRFPSQLRRDFAEMLDRKRAERLANGDPDYEVFRFH